jgi:hypothetical protein
MDRESSKAARRARIAERVAKSRRVESAVRSRSQPGEGYGTAVARFLDLATRFNASIATELSEILHACGCDRETAIATLNEVGPSWAL